jgi:RNA polymerase sigma-70 factor (ECF subfamily)
MDNALFEEKYSLYSDLVFKLSMTYLGNQSDAEDVTQDVFVKLFTNAPEFETLQHERYWMIRVTINACKNHLGTFWNRNTVGMDTIQDMPYTESYHEVTQLLLNLPPKYRVVLYLYYYEGYSIEELATILKLSKSAVKMRLKRGRERLKLDLEEESDYGRKRLYPCDRQL